jgi:hypothetical protein
VLCWKTKIKGEDRKEEREKGYTGPPWLFDIEFLDCRRQYRLRYKARRSSDAYTASRLPLSTPDPLLQCLCHFNQRLPTTLLTTFKPVRGKGNVRFPWKQILPLPNVLLQRIPPKTLRKISMINPRVLPLSHPNTPQYSRIRP